MATRKKGLYSAFVGHLPADVEEKEVKDLFSRCGIIRNIYLTCSDNTLDKYGFVRFETPQEVIEAVKLHGRRVKGKVMIVDYAEETAANMKEYKESQKKTSNQNDNQTKKSKEFSSKHSGKGGNKKDYYSVYVGHLHPDVTEREVKDLFKGCGEIQDIFFGAHADTGNKFGFIRYSGLDEVLKAVSHLHGWKIKNQSMIVDFAHDTVRRIPKDKESHTITIVPNVNLSLDASDKTSDKPSQFDYVINRSRVQETCCLLRSKMSPSEGNGNFHHLMDQIDCYYNLHTVIAQKQALSPQCKLSVADICDRIRTEVSQEEQHVSQVMADIFMEKYSEVTEMVDNLMKDVNSESCKKDSPQNFNQIHRVKSSLTLMTGAVSPVNKSCISDRPRRELSQSGRLERSASKDCLLPLSNISSNAPVMSKLLPSVEKEGSPEKFISKSSSSNKRSTSLIELGKMVRNKWNNNELTILVNNRDKGHDSHRKWDNEESTCVFEGEMSRTSVSTEKNSNKSSPQGREKMAQSTWASDLFCQLLDTQLSLIDSNPDGKESG